ncbi:micronuclear linker histone polyprotein-like isoform X2 [Cebidichthys violaceus]|uniref:micronuclear linker histone polyprotein-like isoform X2 n=1 Tax=Cebidichthys violaceus TaxID=271503 RepID=UPI0035CAAB90
MEKLLEDIMMGLNILPNLDGDCKKPHCLQPHHDGAPAVCQVPVTEDERPQSRTHAAFGAAGLPGYYQVFGTQVGHASTDTAQNQPSCSSLPSVQQQQQQQQQHSSTQHHSSVTSTGQRHGPSHQGMPLSKTLNCPYPEALGGQRLLSTLTYYPAFQAPPSQDNLLELFPLITGNEAQSLHSLPCMDDLRLPQCLSPLEPSTSAAKHPPTANGSTSQSESVQPPPSVHGRPWLSVNMGSLQFPLSAITRGANASESLPLDSNRRRQKHLELNPPSGESRVTCSVREVEERGTMSAGPQNVVKLKSDLRKKHVKGKQGESKGDAAVPKRRRRRKRPCSPQEASSPLECKQVKVSDDAKDQINLSVCLVSLSSNNVLAKEREMAAGSNVPDTFVGTTNEPSTIAESRREKPRGPGDLNANRTRIRTRGFLKRTLETTSSTSVESTVLQPVVSRAPIVNKEGVPKRGRGRPRKIRVEEIPSESAITVEKSHEVKREPQEESGKTGKRKKRIRNRSKVEAVPLVALSAEAEHNSDVIPTGRKLGATKRMVSLKEFQKLIKRQHSKTRKSKESQGKETSGTARAVEREEGKTCGSRLEESTNGTERDAARPRIKAGVKERRAVSDVAVGENRNQAVNKSAAECDESQRDETNASTGNETRPLGDESLPVTEAETEQPLKSPDEETARDEGVSDNSKQTAIHEEGSSRGDVPHEDKMPSVDNLNLQTPERHGPPLSHAGGFGTSAGCDQEEEEEEEEIDVLLCSPDKVPQTKDCENGLDSMALIPEEEEEEEEKEEEEEDMSEIDVTGDETE